MNSELIERITKLMKDKNILQKDLVNEMKCSKGYISGVCNGTKSPSEKFINSLSKLSGKSVHWILYGKEDGDDIDTLNSVINLYIENELITEFNASKSSPSSLPYKIQCTLLPLSLERELINFSLGGFVPLHTPLI